VNRIHLSSFNDKKSNVDVKNPRCLEKFEMSCGTKATRETYVYHLDGFLK